MRRTDFDFELPPDLIAQSPAERGTSRLLVLKDENIEDKFFPDLVDLLNEGDLLVFNDTRVIPARLYGHKQSGGQVEILVERLLNQNRILAQVRSGKSLSKGSSLYLDSGVRLEVLGRQDEWIELQFQDPRSVLEILEEVGHVPLPPYIRRADTPLDRDRYQTVYARSPGAVAAPTAGLHFSEAILKKLAQKGVQSTYVTLHVGAGTFQPMRVEYLTDHKMHREWLEVSEGTVGALEQTRRKKRRVVAVGTTTARALESASKSGVLAPFQGETDIFIYPGYRFRSVDALITNFHLPQSTLLMLVCAFAGQKRVLEAYQHAIHNQYRFFSYGDAMFSETH
ncbi:tRNA preQ1(34) S-adenosylmethionine ribosyltransferase-isomerase [Gammaproteobacteria bacterium]